MNSQDDFEKKGRKRRGATRRTAIGTASTVYSSSLNERGSRQRAELSWQSGRIENDTTATANVGSLDLARRRSSCFPHKPEPDPTFFSLRPRLAPPPQAIERTSQAKDVASAMNQRGNPRIVSLFRRFAPITHMRFNRAPSEIPNPLGNRSELTRCTMQDAG